MRIRQPGIHQECPSRRIRVYPDGRTISAAGGWHDAADLTQGVGNTAESGIAMLELASAVKGKDTILYERLLEEARWGLNWTMRTRFGDGYRQGGLIIGIWTKNIRGDKDDMQSEARNTPSDNLIAASYCALPSRISRRRIRSSPAGAATVPSRISALPWNCSTHNEQTITRQSFPLWLLSPPCASIASPTTLNIWNKPPASPCGHGLPTTGKAQGLVDSLARFFL